jgi:hypothetical protein
MLKSRGLGARYLGQGADGLYIFNFHQGYQVNMSVADGSYRYNTELLTELGSAEGLRALDKLYVATHRVTKADGEWRGAFDVDREWGQVRAHGTCNRNESPQPIHCRPIAVAGRQPPEALGSSCWFGC